MKIDFKKLGFIKKGCIETNDITIIFGPNNVGKTYLSYSIYSILLEYKKNFTSISMVTDEMIDELFLNKVIDCNYKDIFKLPNQNDLCKNISDNLQKFFKDTSGVLSEASITVNSESDVFDIYSLTFAWNLKLSERVLLRVSKENNNENIKFEILEVNSESESEPNIDLGLLKARISFLIDFIGKTNIFKNINKDPFIITSERTGISVFLKEIDGNRNDVVNEIAFGEDETYISNIINKRISKFSEPINNNINIIRLQCTG